MEKERLKRFVLDELKKKVPEEIAADEQKAAEFISKNFDGSLLDRLMDEFCAKNPNDLGVLNVFNLTDEQMDEIRKNPEKAIADGVIDRVKYGQIINHAALAYQSNALIEHINGLPDSAFALKK